MKLHPFFIGLKIVLLSVGLLLPFSGHNQIILNTALSEGSSEEEVLVHVVIKEMPPFIIMQFAMIWDPEIWVYQGIAPGGLVSNINSFSPVESSRIKGQLRFLSIGSTRFSEGDTLFTLRFDRLSFEPHNIAFFEDDPSVDDFFPMLFGDNLELDSENTAIHTSGTRFLGRLFIDRNGDCMIQPGEGRLGQESILLTDGTTIYSAARNNLALREAYLPPGKYTILPLPGFSNCNPTDTFVSAMKRVEEELVKRVLFRYESYCPALRVYISSDRLRRCFDNNTYLITYENIGGTAAEDAFLEVQFDEFLEVQSTSVPAQLIENNKYRFDLGTVPPYSNDKIKVVVKVNCENTTLGQTHCVEASIFPDTICSDIISDDWSKAHLSIDKSCTTEGVVFQITNTGSGNMSAPVAYTIFQDRLVYEEGMIQLAATAQQRFVLPANGVTYTISTQQVPHHPIPTSLFAHQEGCGRNEAGTFSQGIIHQLSLSEANPFYSLNCQANVGAFDPNDKRGFPMGYGPLQYVEQDQSLTYHIRFQNTGTDTAFRVIVVDTLSPSLDMNTIRNIESSHDYTVAYQPDRSIIFTFDDILLVDSFTNEPSSNGYISFEIDQQKAVPLETLITNQAAIYFDFNKPIFTNRTQHRIGEDFYEKVEAVTSIKNIPSPTLSVSPNPLKSYTIIYFKEKIEEEGNLLLYNYVGNLVQQHKLSPQSQSVKVSRENLPSGIYFVKLVAGNQLLGSSKIIVH